MHFPLPYASPVRMNRQRPRLTLCPAVLWIAFGLASTFAAAAAPNMVPCGDFESGSAAAVAAGRKLDGVVTLATGEAGKNAHLRVGCAWWDRSRGTPPRQEGGDGQEAASGSGNGWTVQAERGVRSASVMRVITLAEGRAMMKAALRNLKFIEWLGLLGTDARVSPDRAPQVAQRRTRQPLPGGNRRSRELNLDLEGPHTEAGYVRSTTPSEDEPYGWYCVESGKRKAMPLARMPGG